MQWLFGVWRAEYHVSVQRSLGQAWIDSFQIKSNRVWEWLGFAYVICWLIGLNILTILFLGYLKRASMTSKLMAQKHVCA